MTPPSRPPDNIPALWERFRTKDAAALSRLLTLSSQSRYGEQIESLCREVSAETPVIALTGPGGVGKSSLMGTLATEFVQRGRHVGVLACDPQSPLTGGALLGDRCRIVTSGMTDRLFLRSLSAVTGGDAIAEHLALMLSLMRGFGFDLIFVETVGAGQGETAIRRLADIVLLVLQPQTGDSLQWEKAGILEVADLIVVNKSDLSGADRMAADLLEHVDVQVLQTSVQTGSGIDQLIEFIDRSASNTRSSRANQKMSSPDAHANSSPPTDPLLTEIADYVTQEQSFSDEAYETARLCLLDSLGCALLTTTDAQCMKLLGPVVPGAGLPGGARVPGTPFELDPVTAAFNIGCLIRWLDYNDTWLAAEWGHPSDNFGGILAVADYQNRNADSRLTVRDVLTAAIEAYEIQGVIALENSFNRVGLDHVILVRVATTAVVTHLLGGNRQQVADALSNAWLDGGALRTYRHAPNTGSRKSWAAGDATRRGVQLALWTLAGEMGYATPLSAPRWGFQDVVFGGRPLVLSQPLGSYVMEHILFKVSYPVEFHAQTAVEAGVRLHPEVEGRLDEISGIRIETQEAAMRIINKTGPLHNPADRDHCLQFATAVALLNGTLTAADYHEPSALDPRIDHLRQLMEVVEEPRYSRDYLDPEKRSIANSVQVTFRDGTATERIEVEYPLGHRRRRDEAVPLLRKKFQANAQAKLTAGQVTELLNLFADPARLDAMPVDELMTSLSTAQHDL